MALEFACLCLNQEWKESDPIFQFTSISEFKKNCESQLFADIPISKAAIS